MSEDNLTDPPESAPPPMTAGQKKFLAALGGVLAVMALIGAWYLYDIGLFSKRPNYEVKWAYCDPGDRCTAIRAPCDSWVAINDRYLDDAQAYYDHMIAMVEESPQMECAAASRIPPRPAPSACQGSACHCSRAAGNQEGSA